MGGKNGINRRIVIIEIRRENFDDDSRISGANRLDRLPKVLGAAIRQIVASYGSDHHMLQPHSPRGLCNARRFIRFESKGFGGRHGAKVAGARAAISGDHERCCPLAPALPMVGTARAFANSVQL
jgi:hypothetical protein